MRPPAPSLLYKYRSISNDKEIQRLEDTLVHGECFFSSPYGFNDVFDCKPIMSFDVTDREYINGYIAIARKQGDRRLRKVIETEAKSYIGTETDPRSEATSRKRQEEFHKRTDVAWGVYCLASSPTNLLMWSHYAASYTGVCLEMDSSKFADLAEIVYEKTRPTIKWLEPVPISKLVDRALFTKSTDWAYEKEWRALSLKPGAYRSGGLVKRVIFGPKCGDEVRTKIIQIVKKSNMPISFAEVIPDPRSYQLHLRDV